MKTDPDDPDFRQQIEQFQNDPSVRGMTLCLFSGDHYVLQNLGDLHIAKHFVSIIRRDGHVSVFPFEVICSVDVLIAENES